MAGAEGDGVPSAACGALVAARAQHQGRARCANKHTHVVVDPIHVLNVLLLVQIMSSHVQCGTGPAGRWSLRGRSIKARQVPRTLMRLRLSQRACIIQNLDRWGAVEGRLRVDLEFLQFCDDARSSD
jgi:hypothetical protein